MTHELTKLIYGLAQTTDSTGSNSNNPKDNLAAHN